MTTVQFPRELLDAPTPTPVPAAWMRFNDEQKAIFTRGKRSNDSEPLYPHPTAYRMTATQPQGELVAIYQAEFLGEGGGGWSDVEHAEYLSLRSSPEFRLRTVYAEQPAPVAQKYDDTLLPFLALMRKELHANSHKGDREAWLAMTLEQALGEIRHHVEKLEVPVLNHDREAIREHTADVANCAMMLADIAGVLAHE